MLRHLRALGLLMSLTAPPVVAHAASGFDAWQKQATIHKMPAPSVIDTQGSEFCIVTQHAGYDAGYLPMTLQSQQGYALRHGYSHEAFLDRVSGAAFTDPTRGGLDSVFGGGLFWQKVSVVQKTLNDLISTEHGTTPRCAWVLWLDSDVVITNETILLEDIVEKYAPKLNEFSPHHVQKDIILSTEEYHPINAGVFMVRNTAVGRGYMDALAALYPLYKDSLLPEQSAMTTLSYMVKPWPCTNMGQQLGNHLHPSIALVPQRTFNSFPDYGRNLAEPARWQPCDFIAHFAGVNHDLRAQGIREILETVATCESQDTYRQR